MFLYGRKKEDLRVRLTCGTAEHRCSCGSKLEEQFNVDLSEPGKDQRVYTIKMHLYSFTVIFTELILHHVVIFDQYELTLLDEG